MLDIKLGAGEARTLLMPRDQSAFVYVFEGSVGFGDGSPTIL